MSVIPARRARISRAVGKSTPCVSCTQVNTSPLLPHPKQWNRPRAGSIDSDGVFSSWNGQMAEALRPDRFTLVTSAASSARSVRSLTRSLSSEE